MVLRHQTATCSNAFTAPPCIQKGILKYASPATYVIILCYFMVMIFSLDIARQDNTENSIISLSAMKKSFSVDHGRSLRGGPWSSTFEMDRLRKAFPPSVWTLAGRNSDSDVSQLVQKHLPQNAKDKAMQLCGAFLYSSIRRAARVSDMGESTFVSTGDIPYMWTRDSAVQMGIYVGRMHDQKWLRLIVEGAIRRQSFNIIQDPYANAYYEKWVDPQSLDLKDRVIVRGGWVATRNFELDSGAYARA
jgi:hypothetical protein